MFDFDAGKLLIVGIVALIFIPPKDLPRVLRQVGQFVGKMKRMASDFQGQFMDAMREADMADLRREAQKLADSAKVDVGQVALGQVALGQVAMGKVDLGKVDLGLDKAGFDSVQDLHREIAKPAPARLPAPDLEPTPHTSDLEHPASTHPA